MTAKRRLSPDYILWNGRIRGGASAIDIREDDVRGAEVLALLEEHLADVARHSPPESVHALNAFHAAVAEAAA